MGPMEPRPIPESTTSTYLVSWMAGEEGWVGIRTCPSLEDALSYRDRLVTFSSGLILRIEAQSLEVRRGFYLQDGRAFPR